MSLVCGRNRSVREADNWISGGRLFQRMDAATGNECRPTVTRRYARTCSRCDDQADKQHERADSGMASPSRRKTHDSKCGRRYVIRAISGTANKAVYRAYWGKLPGESPA